MINENVLTVDPNIANIIHFIRNSRTTFKTTRKSSLFEGLA